MTQDPGPPAEGHPTLAPTEARQGLRGRHLLIVLLVSTVLAAGGLFAAWAWKAPDLARPGSRQRAVEVVQRPRRREDFACSRFVPPPGRRLSVSR